MNSLLVPLAEVFDTHFTRTVAEIGDELAANAATQEEQQEQVNKRRELSCRDDNDNADGGRGEDKRLVG